MDASDYTQYRPLMFSIAYRMTGSVSDADGGLIAVIALDVLDGQVQAIRTVANPEKLRHIGPVSQTWHLRWREDNKRRDNKRADSK